MPIRYEEQKAAQMETDKFWGNVCFMTAVLGAVAIVGVLKAKTSESFETRDGKTGSALAVPAQTQMKTAYTVRLQKSFGRGA